MPDINRECSKCGKVYPATLEFFHKQNDVKCGLTRKCKICRNKKNRKWRITHIRTVLDKIKGKEYNKTYSLKNRENIRKKSRERRKRIRDNFNLDDSSVHKYIAKIKMKPKFCIICNEIKKLELACIDHQYSRNPKDYYWLCNGCHQIFDNCRKVIKIES